MLTNFLFRVVWTSGLDQRSIFVSSFQRYFLLSYFVLFTIINITCKYEGWVKDEQVVFSQHILLINNKMMPEILLMRIHAAGVSKRKINRHEEVRNGPAEWGNISVTKMSHISYRVFKKNYCVFFPIHCNPSPWCRRATHPRKRSECSLAPLAPVTFCTTNSSQVLGGERSQNYKNPLQKKSWTRCI